MNVTLVSRHCVTITASEPPDIPVYTVTALRVRPYPRHRLFGGSQLRRTSPVPACVVVRAGPVTPESSRCLTASHPGPESRPRDSMVTEARIGPPFMSATRRMAAALQSGAAAAATAAAHRHRLFIVISVA